MDGSAKITPNAPMQRSDDALCIRELRVAYGRAGAVLRSVDLRVGPGRVTALVGRSGCGKSTLALACMGLLPRDARVSGRIQVVTPNDVREIAGASEAELQRIRGGCVGMIFQSPAAALNPVMRVGAQLAEAVRLHRRGSRAQVRRRVVQLLADVELMDDVRWRFPHALSGGMQQRVMIAIALARNPRLLIADEPTSALDAGVQADILKLLVRLCRLRGMAMLLITHDLAVAGAWADDVAVLAEGRIVERGPVREVIAGPRHQAARALVAAARALTQPKMENPRPI
jgi:ABC-type glutathione transport system ATPase component